MILCQNIKYILILLHLYFTYGNQIHHRQKRYLFYPFGGTYKMVFSFAIPVKFAPKMEMGIGWNFQYQMALPRNTTVVQRYPPIVSREFKNKRDVDSLDNDIEKDLDEDETSDGAGSDRASFYGIIEDMLNKKGINGRGCLLRTICEHAQSDISHEENGIYGQVLDLLLTPKHPDSLPDSDLDVAYLEAQRAGEFGVECDSLYTACDIEGGLFDLFSFLDSSLY